MLFNFKKPTPGTGNTLIVGQSKTGKSTLSKKIALHSVPAGCRVIYFDIGKSAYVTTQLVEGNWIDLENKSGAGIFSPIRTLGKAGVCEWLFTLLENENVQLSPEKKSSVISAVTMVKNQGKKYQTISGLIPYIMDTDVKNALNNYTISSGQFPIFDAKEEAVCFETNFLCLECKRVFESGTKNSANILSFLFSRIESIADGEPVYIIFDDASLALGNDCVQDRLLTQINNMRKQNVSFVFAVHNISDIGKRLKDSLLNHCGVRVYTPNSQVTTNTFVRESYRSMGLTDSQLSLIATGKPRQEYIVQTADGKCQVIDLMIKPGSIAQIITDGSNINNTQIFKRLLAEHGRPGAIREYLRLKGGL